MKECKSSRIFGLCLLVILIGTAAVSFSEEAKPAAPTGQFTVKPYTPPQPLGQGATGITFLGTVVKLAFTLVFVVALIYGTVFVLKLVMVRYRPMSMRSLGMVDILDSLALGPNKTLHAIRIYNHKVLLVAVTEKDVQLLSTIDQAQAVGEILAQVQQKWNSTRTFREELSIAKKKTLAQASLGKYVSELKNFLRSMKSS